VPWRGPSYAGEFPSLGWSVGEWIEAHCVIPDGDLAGGPFLLTDDMWRFLVWHYRIRLAAVPERWQSAWQFRRSALIRPQKWGKGPFYAAIGCAEARAEVVFDGWNAAGEPVGRPWPTPWIQVTAQSEGQTDNIWRALQPMIEEGPLAEEIPDTGLTRINLPGGGLIEPVTASAGARLGQRITTALQDETHSWVQARGGVKLADTQKRNLAGTGGRALESSNSWDPAQRSVAQLTAEAARKQRDIHLDHILAPATLSFRDKRARRRILRIVYGDSAVDRGGWVDLDRIDAEAVELMARDPAQAERFFGNRAVAGERQYLAPELWTAQSRPQLYLRRGDAIAVFFDGSINEDSTVLVACRIADGLISPLAMWHKPDGVDGATWEVPRPEVHDMVRWTFATYRVVLLQGDPHEWRSELGDWAERYGGPQQRVRELPTHLPTRWGPYCDRFAVDVRTGKVIHDGDKDLADHVANARKAKRGAFTVVVKETEDSPLKIDGCVGAIGAWETRRFAIEHGLVNADEHYAYTA